MKKMIIILASLLVPLLASPQAAVNNTIPPIKNDKVRNGKTVLPWVLTGGGVALLVTGISIHGSKKSYSTNEEMGTALIIAGSAAVLTSIVLFSSSALCEAGDKMASMNLTIENAGVMESFRSKTGIAICYYPALSFRLGL